jgi:AcrR family transcriptional regulator
MLNSQGRTGRRRGVSSGTRAAILKAARASFAKSGYDGTTFRGVAGKAGVDPALVVHFFGTKAGLFAASLELPVRPEELEEVLQGDRATLGRRIATFYLKRVFHERAQTAQSLLRSSVANKEAAAILRGVIESTAITLIERLFPGPETALRGELVASHMMGIFLARHILKVEPIASCPDEELIELVAPALQHYLAPRRKP